MSIRRNWTPQQDNTLLQLKQHRKQTKWSVIAKLMQTQFNIIGRTGKQCRERYHNHLDKSINAEDWNQYEENMLYHLHEEYGNKWSLIAKRLPGRSDNCVKNHFYSKLRKALRKVNKICQEVFQKDYKQIKNHVLYKVLQTAEAKYKISTKVDEQQQQFCSSIKNRLFKFNVQDSVLSQSEFLEAEQIYRDFNFFLKDNKKCAKIKKSYSMEPSDEFYLHPKTCLKLRKTSTNSNGSDFQSSSEYSSVYGSSSSQMSDSSIDMDIEVQKQVHSQKVLKIEEGSSTKVRDSHSSRRSINQMQQVTNLLTLLCVAPINHLHQSSHSFNPTTPHPSLLSLSSPSFTTHSFQQAYEQRIPKISYQQQPIQIYSYMDQEVEQHEESGSPKCKYFQDIKLGLRIISPKVSQDSQISFDLDLDLDQKFGV